MKTSGHDAVDAVDGFGFGLRADLKNVVVIGFLDARSGFGFVLQHRTAHEPDTVVRAVARGLPNEVLFGPGPIPGFDQHNAARPDRIEALEGHFVARGSRSPALLGRGGFGLIDRRRGTVGILPTIEFQRSAPMHSCFTPVTDGQTTELSPDDSLGLPLRAMGGSTMTVLDRACR